MFLSLSSPLPQITNETKNPHGSGLGTTERKERVEDPGLNPKRKRKGVGEVGLRRKVRVFREEGGSGDFAKLRVMPSEAGKQLGRAHAHSLLIHLTNASAD